MVFSQSEEVSKWQQRNPNVVFISQDKFDELSDTQKSVLKNNYIIFSESITMSDIELYQEKTVVKSVNHSATIFDYNDPNANFIKVWLGESHVYCIQKDIYDTWTEDEMNEHPEVLVYPGEYLTIQDITDYEGN